MGRAHDLFQLTRVRGQRRHQDNRVAQWTKDDAPPAEFLADFGADAASGIETAELDANHEAFLSDFGDRFQRTKSIQHFCELKRLALNVGEEIIFLEKIQ